jgi:hypothetical protein
MRTFLTTLLPSSAAALVAMVALAARVFLSPKMVGLVALAAPAESG